QPVTYSFTAGKPGTYLYHSGTRPDIQVDMGLVGALIVRPANFSAANRTAYGTAASGFDHEYLFLLTEMDPLLHERMARDPLAPYDISGFFASYWFVNGRTALDTVVPAGAPWLPTQPYNIMPRMNPGQRTLLRVIGGGRDIHPYHTHGNNTVVIARDGRLLESAPGATLQIPTKDSRLPAESFPDLSYSDYTIQVEPGATYDAIFRWTGAGLGWDIHGHAPGDPCLWQSGEDCSAGGDHGKPLPVDIPGDMSLSYGKHYGGSTFLGSTRQLPPGTGNVNMDGGLFFMWHSHTEKEMTNYNVFPGGMMTMMIIEPPSVQIPE
ncbi:MAG: hypothetical protein K2Q10_07380, partial [Rhodospirillales bacterium]|nr:hypothetical protein [Rhodospirillales bacterium]